MKHMSKMIMVLALITSIGVAITMKKVDPNPCQGIVGDEILSTGLGIPYKGGRQSPGDAIGTSYHDYQANGSFGQRLGTDDYFQAHIDWTKRNQAGDLRYCAWNFRYADGSFYGETQAAPSWSGYVQLDVTRDASPDDQRTIVAYHYDAGTGYFSWIDIDAGNGWGNWPNSPKTPAATDHIWPYICAAENGNIVMATANQPVPGPSLLHLYYTTNEGADWQYWGQFDSCACISQFVRSSYNSNRVVFAWTQFITDTLAGGQYDNNIWYMLSTDGGETWDTPVNVTDYQPYPTDSVRAYTDVNALFDMNDDLHIVWSGRRVTGDFWVASKIFHWDEVNDQITIVNSPSVHYPEPGGWWIQGVSGGDYGGWRMPADQPQLVVDPANNNLYCLWCGNDDDEDFGASGFINGDFYGSKSTDGGLTWTPYDSLTYTRSPGAAQGDCYDEDYMTAYPLVVNDSIFVTYVEDKDAGGLPQGEGGETENPVRCWVFWKKLIGIEEHDTDTPKFTSLSVYPNPTINRSTISYALSTPSNVSIRLFDVAGRLVKNIDSGYKEAGDYKLNVNTSGIANGTYFLILTTKTEEFCRPLVVVR